MFHEDFMRGFKSEGFSRTMIEFIHCDSDLRWGNGIEVKFFGEELSDEPVHVFVSATFPRGVRMGKEVAGIELGGDTLMAGKLFSVVGCNRVNRGCKRRQQRDDRVSNRRRFFARNVGNQCVARTPFVKRYQGLFVTYTNNQVSFPVTESLSSGYDVRTQINGNLIRDCAATITTTVPFSSDFLTAQSEMKVSASEPISIDMSIDSFVGNARQTVSSKVASNLLRTPQLAELGGHERPSLRRDSWRVARSLRSGYGKRVSLFGSIATLSLVAGKLSSDARLVAIKQFGNLASVVPCLGKDGNLVTFRLGEMCVVHFGQLRLGGQGVPMLSHLAHHSGLSKVALRN
jgi:hypothetical protein